MKPLTPEELQLNERAASIASSALGESVEAACRIEQVTQDQQMAAVGVGGINRGLVKGMRGMSKAMMPRMGADMDNMRGGGLPKSFILAVTTSNVVALQDKENGSKVLKSWDRSGFTAKLTANAGAAMASGVPDDRQLMTIYLPIEGAKTKYMKAAANITAAAGAAGQPHRMMIGRDQASQAVIDRVTANAPAPGSNVIINGQPLSAMMGQQAQPAAPDPAAQLTQLAALRDQGVLTDEEFTAQKSRILGG
jgi:putative oligomerization/nucleic acid binding protein